MPSHRLPPIENVAVQGWRLHATSLSITFGVDGCDQENCASSTYFLPNSVSSKGAVGYRNCRRVTNADDADVLFDRLSSTLFAVHSSPMSLEAINRRIHRYLVEIACVYGLGCSVSPTVVALFPVASLPVATDLHEPRPFDQTLQHSSVDYRGARFPLTYCAVCANSGSQPTHVIVRCGRPSLSPSGMVVDDVSYRTVRLSVSVDVLRISPNEAARRAIVEYSDKLDIPIGRHGVVFDRVAGDYEWMLPYLRAQKLYALPEAVRLGLSQMLQPGELDGSSHASVLYPLFMETREYDLFNLSSPSMEVTERKVAEWAIQKMISYEEEASELIFSELLLAADRSTPQSRILMFNRTYANPRFCARCNDYTTMGFMACLLHRMGLTEGVLTDPYAGVAHECLRLAYPPQFGPNCKSVPSRSSYDRYLQPSFANTENRLGMSVAMTHAIFSRIEEVLSTPSPAGRPAQIPLIRFIPSPPVVGKVQIRSGGSVQNLNYYVLAMTKAIETISKAKEGASAAIQKTKNTLFSVDQIAGRVVDYTGAPKIFKTSAKVAIYAGLAGLAWFSMSAAAGATFGATPLETTTLTVSSGNQLVPSSVNTAPTAITKLQNGKVVYDFLAPPVPSVVTDTSKKITLVSTRVYEKVREQYIYDEKQKLKSREQRPRGSKSTPKPESREQRPKTSESTPKPESGEQLPKTSESTDDIEEGDIETIDIDPTESVSFNTDETESGQNSGTVPTKASQERVKSIKNFEKQIISGREEVSEFLNRLNQYDDKDVPPEEAFQEGSPEGSALKQQITSVSTAVCNATEMLSDTAQETLTMAYFNQSISNNTPVADVQCYVNDTVEYDSWTTSTSPDIPLFYMSSSGQCFDKDGICPAPLADIEVGSDGSLPDTVSVDSSQVHNPLNISMPSYDIKFDSTLADLINKLKKASRAGADQDTQKAAKEIADSVFNVNVTDSNDDKLTYGVKLSSVSNRTVLKLEPPKKSPRTTTFIDYWQKLTTFSEKQDIEAGSCGVVCNYALDFVKGSAYQLGISSRRVQSVASGLRELATTFQEYTKPETLKATNSASKELLKTTIDFFNGKPVVGKPIFTPYSASGIKVTMAPSQSDASSVGGSAVQQPSAKAPTPLKCALQTSVAVAEHLERRAVQAASDLDAAISIVKGNAELSKLTESSQFLQEAEKLADHQRRISNNYNAARDVCARAEVDVVDQPEQVREALKDWVNDTRSGQFECGYECATFDDVIKAVKATGDKPLVKNSSTSATRTIYRFKDVNPSNPFSSFAEQTISKEIDKIKLTASGNQVGIDDFGDDWESAIRENPSSSASANESMLKKFKKAVQTRIVGAVETTSSLFSSFSQKIPDLTDALSETFDLFIEATNIQTIGISYNYA